MIRSELVQKLCGDFPDLTQREVENVVSAIFDSITEQLAEGGRVELRGFGAFSSRQRDARVGRNPRTGFARLSPREMDVIRQLMWGMRLSVVASRMGLNIRTASCYKRNALSKLNMGSVAELVRYSSEQGIAV